jgi:geranylgeranyl pyrophosphate synthase
MRSQAQGSQFGSGRCFGHLLASGGKRVRTATTLLTGGMLGGDTERLITLAAAVELLHTATLVHDDLIDGRSCGAVSQPSTRSGLQPPPC